MSSSVDVTSYFQNEYFCNNILVIVFSPVHPSEFIHCLCYPLFFLSSFFFLHFLSPFCVYIHHHHLHRSHSFILVDHFKKMIATPAINIVSLQSIIKTISSLKIPLVQQLHIPCSKHN